MTTKTTTPTTPTADGEYTYLITVLRSGVMPFESALVAEQLACFVREGGAIPAEWSGTDTDEFIAHLDHLLDLYLPAAPCDVCGPDPICDRPCVKCGA